MDDRITTLHFASRFGWAETVLILLCDGVDIDAKSDEGDTPLLLAAANKHKHIVEYLIDEGADINCSTGSYHYTVLHYASRNGWLDIVQTLLEKGVDINAKDDDSNTPLLLAAINNQKEIVECLISAGADINCTGNWSNHAVFHYAAEHGLLEIVQSRMEKNADARVRTDCCNVPVLLAVENGYKEIVELLVNGGASMNWDTSANWTSLHCASKNGWVDIVESLLKKGANIEAKSDSGETSLQIAVSYNNIEIVEHLLKAGADVNVECDGGNLPLPYLVRKSPDTELVRVLIKSGTYLKSIDYKRIMENPLLKVCILQDVELCSQVIINEFNHKYLPDLYKLSMACKILPSIENMTIGKNSQSEHEVLQSVKREMEEKGHCNVLEVHPTVLKMLSAKSCLSYCNTIKRQDGASNQMKSS